MIPTMKPTGDLPPMILFEDCKKGETSAKTGCTPASGEGGKQEGADTPEEVKESPTFQSASQDFVEALKSGDSDAAMDAVDSMEEMSDSVKGLFTGRDKGARNSVDDAILQMRTAIATGENDIAASYANHLSQMASVGEIGKKVASREEAKGKAKEAKKIMKGVISSAGQKMESLEAKLQKHGHNQAHGLISGVGEQLGLYLDNVSDFIKGPGAKKAAQGLKIAKQKISDITPPELKKMKSQGLSRMFKDAINWLDILDRRL